MSTPASTIEPRLIASWPAAPPASPQSPYAAATPMFDAAGIVVTEISTPISAPDFALVRESIPADPGHERDEEREEVRIRDEPGELVRRGREVIRARARSHLKKSVATQAADDPDRETDAERHERAAREVRTPLRPAPRDRPASGPNSGPTTMAPTIRIGWSSRMPDRPDLHRQHHEQHEADRELGVLARALLDLLPDDGVGGQAGRRLLGRVGPVRDRRLDVLHRDRARRAGSRAP